jgi:hypothetical protein
VGGLALSPVVLWSQQPTAPSPEDVSSINGIIDAFYDVISGPAGQPRQWERDRTLYIPGVRFVGISEQREKIQVDLMDHGAYVKSSDAGMVKHGFFDKEIGRSTRRFGHMAQVMSAYEIRSEKEGPVLARGINFIELHFDGKRWWISSVQWDGERPNNPIPKAIIGKFD